MPPTNDKGRRAGLKTDGKSNFSSGAAAAVAAGPNAKTSKAGNEKTNAANRISSVSNGNRQEGNPFEEEEWDEYPNDALVDNGEPGVPVKALYDYEGAEFDELSFRKGSFLHPFIHLFICLFIYLYHFKLFYLLLYT